VKNEPRADKLWEWPSVRVLAALTTIGLAIGIWLLGRPSSPNQQEAEQEVATGIGQAEKRRSRRLQGTGLGFPLNANGTGTKTLDTTPSRDLKLSISPSACSAQ
jgi:uncharacterized membrane protein